MSGLRDAVAAALVVGVIGGVAAVTDRPTPVVAARGTVRAVTTGTVVCPDVGGSAEQSTRLTVANLSPRAGTTTVHVSQLRGSTSTRRQIRVDPSWTETLDRPGGPVAVTASGPAAASLVAAQTSLVNRFRRRGLTGATCAAPRATWWLLGADGRVGHEDTLIVADPAPTPATVHISFLSSQRSAVTAPKVASVVVPARGFRAFPLARVAPEAPDLAIQVQATGGLVTAAVEDVQDEGNVPVGHDWIPASTAPATAVMVPGIPAGPGPRTLYVANPGGSQTAVRLRVLTDTGAFAPSGHPLVDVPAGETVAVDLTKALQGRAATVQLSADRPVAASAVATLTAPAQLSDLVWRAGAPPLAPGDTWAQGWTREGRLDLLALTAPAGDARVTLTSQTGHHATVAVPAGRLDTVDLRRLLGSPAYGPGAVTITAITGGPVWGVQTVRMAGANGPLVTGLPPGSALPATRVPAVVDDPSAALGKQTPNS